MFRAEALGLVERFVEHYNRVRMHSSLGDVTPQHVLDDKPSAIWAELGAEPIHLPRYDEILLRENDWMANCHLVDIVPVLR